jgi:hypothetical protein
MWAAMAVQLANPKELALASAALCLLACGSPPPVTPPATAPASVVTFATDPTGLHPATRFEVGQPIYAFVNLPKPFVDYASADQLGHGFVVTFDVYRIDADGERVSLVDTNDAAWGNECATLPSSDTALVSGRQFRLSLVQPPSGGAEVSAAPINAASNCLLDDLEGEVYYGDHARGEEPTDQPDDAPVFGEQFEIDVWLGQAELGSGSLTIAPESAASANAKLRAYEAARQAALLPTARMPSGEPDPNGDGLRQLNANAGAGYTWIGLVVTSRTPALQRSSKSGVILDQVESAVASVRRNSDGSCFTIPVSLVQQLGADGNPLGGWSPQPDLDLPLPGWNDPPNYDDRDAPIQCQFAAGGAPSAASQPAGR